MLSPEAASWRCSRGCGAAVHKKVWCTSASICTTSEAACGMADAWPKTALAIVPAYPNELTLPVAFRSSDATAATSAASCVGIAHSVCPRSDWLTCGLSTRN